MYIYIYGILIEIHSPLSSASKFSAFGSKTSTFLGGGVGDKVLTYM